MLEEFIKFANKQDKNKRYNIYYLALNHHNILKIKKFKKLLQKGIILHNYNQNMLKENIYISDEILFNEYYDFIYYYKYHNNKKEYNDYLRLIMNTINLYSSK